MNNIFSHGINLPIYYWVIGLITYLSMGLLFALFENILKVEFMSNLRSIIFSRKVGAFWVSGSLIVIIYPFLPW